MDINFILLNKDNRNDFASVYPDFIKDSENRVSIGAYDSDGGVLGAASYTLSNYEYDIDWLYVDEAARRKGVATALIEEIKKAVDYTGQMYPLSCHFPVNDEKIDLHRFFLSVPDMDVHYSHERFFVTPSQFKDSELAKIDPHEHTVKTKLLFDAPKEIQDKILSFVAEDDLYNVIDYDNWKAECVPKYCRYVMDDDELTTLIVVQPVRENEMEIAMLYSKNATTLMIFLKQLYDDALKFNPEMTLTYEPVTEDAQRLSSRLFKDLKSDHIYEALY